MTVTVTVYPCRVCGKDIGWDAPSGVCSRQCLDRGQGFVSQQPDLPAWYDAELQAAEAEALDEAMAAEMEEFDRQHGY